MIAEKTGPLCKGQQQQLLAGASRVHCECTFGLRWNAQTCRTGGPPFPCITRNSTRNNPIQIPDSPSWFQLPSGMSGQECLSQRQTWDCMSRPISSPTRRLHWPAQPDSQTRSCKGGDKEIGSLHHALVKSKETKRPSSLDNAVGFDWFNYISWRGLR